MTKIPSKEDLIRWFYKNEYRIMRYARDFGVPEGCDKIQFNCGSLFFTDPRIRDFRNRISLGLDQDRYLHDGFRPFQAYLRNLVIDLEPSSTHHKIYKSLLKEGLIERSEPDPTQEEA